MNKRKNDDIYIRILKYAKEKGMSGFSFNDIKNDLNLTEEEQEFVEMNTLSTDNSVFWWVNDDRKEMALTFDGRAMLLEHQELKEARKSSSRAMTIAIISILLTLLGFLYQICTVTKVQIVGI